MSAKKKLERGSGGIISSVMDSLRRSGIAVTTAEDYSKDWRYLTFMDPKTGLPSIAHEYIVGAAGFRAGTVNQLRGQAGSGKSSLCMLEYGSAVRSGIEAGMDPGAWCGHVETEGGGMDDSRTAEFGLHPGSLFIPKGRTDGEDDSLVMSFESVVEFVDTVRCVIRGGLGGSVNDLGRKSATKFKREEAADPDRKMPILIGIDSLSNLGKEDDTQQDITDSTKSKQPGWLPRQVKAWLRAKAKQYELDLLTLFLTSQETQKIATGMPSYGPPEKTSVAGDAIKYFDTTALDVACKDWKDRTGRKVGREIMLKNFKSKISGATGRRVSFFLTDEDGFDMIHSDAEFLLGKDSPFADGRGIFSGTRLCYRHAGGITCRPLGDGSFRTEEEFVRAFYDNADVLATARDGLRIKGYGLPHESRYKSQYDEKRVYVGDGSEPPADGAAGRVTEEDPVAGDPG